MYIVYTYILWYGSYLEFEFKISRSFDKGKQIMLKRKVINSVIVLEVEKSILENKGSTFLFNDILKIISPSYAR